MPVRPSEYWRLRKGLRPFNTVSVPGLPDRPDPRLDPAIHRSVTEMPREWSPDDHKPQYYFTADAVVRGLGFDEVQIQRYRDLVAQSASFPTFPPARKSLYESLMFDGVDPWVRAEIARRFTRFWEYVQKTDIRIHRPIQKAFETTGGKYIRRVTKTVNGKRKHRYYYDEKKYQQHHGEHTSGEDNQKQYVQKTTLDRVCTKGTCELKEFKDLVQKFGSKSIHDALKGHVESGAISYSKGSFTAQQKKQPTTEVSKKKPLPKIEKGVRFVIPFEDFEK